jgi:hypothetical protein
MTQLNATNPQMKLFIDTLCGYTSDVYRSLTQSSTLSYYLGYSNISLTLVNELLHAIAETSNRKRRRAYIVQLVSMFMGCNLQVRLSCVDQPTRGDWMTPYTTLLADLTYNLRVAYPTLSEQRNLDSIPLRILHRDNSPWWAALVVGDSKHYTSCLRAGILEEVCVTCRWSEDRWLELLEDGGMGDNCGCNHSEYIREEVNAFKRGHIMYLVAGDMVYDKADSTGPQARMRVHVATLADNSVDDDSVVDFTSSNAILIVDRMYGTGALYPRLLQLLLEQYPGRLYVNSQHSHDSSSGERVLVSLCDSRVYSDSDMEYANELTEVRSIVGSEVTRVRNRQVCRCTVHNGSTLFTRRDPPKPPESFNALWRNRVGYSEVIALLSSYYSVPYTVELVNTVSRIPQGIKFGVRFSCRNYNGEHYIRWTFRGVSYALNYYYSYAVLTRTRNDVREMYNVKKGIWTSAVYLRYINPNYEITRHTIKLISKYLPKQPNTRPRKRN